MLDELSLCAHLGDEVLFHTDPSPVSYKDNWKTVNIDFRNFSGGKKKKPVPDIINDYGKLFLNEKSYQLLLPLLSQSGEFLSVIYQNEPGYIFNPLKVADEVEGVDEKLSIKNNYSEIESLFFREENVKHFPIFKTQFDSYIGIYCNQKFRDIVEKNNLQGLNFREDLGNIYSDDPNVCSPKSH